MFELRATLQVRPEAFGALLYDRTDRKLLFLRSPSATAVLLALPATRAAAVAAGAAASGRSVDVVEEEFDQLVASGVISAA